MGISVLIPAFHRHVLLRRTLKSLRLQTMKADQILVLDEGGNSGILSELEWNEGYVPSNPESRWARTLNMGVRFAWPYVKHDFIIICCGDLIIPNDAIEKTFNSHEKTIRVTPTVYSLDRALTARVDTIPWEGTDCGIFGQQEGFMSMKNQFGGQNVESVGWRAQILYSANTREGWEEFATEDPKLPFPAETGVGSDECWLRQIEVDHFRVLTNPGFAVYHQWHPPTFTNSEYQPGSEI
jgi:hypothetical protein